MTPLKWHSLTSSNLRRCAFEEDEDGNTTLHVQFNSGKTYELADVPSSIFNGLLEAGSPGQFYNANIKGVYD